MESKGRPERPASGHVIVLVGLRQHQPTRDYRAQRITQGKSKNEVMRCIKRYIAREVFDALQPPRTTAKTIAATKRLLCTSAQRHWRFNAFSLSRAAAGGTLDGSCGQQLPWSNRSETKGAISVMLMRRRGY